jgi:uncharacterized protein YwqG
MKLREYRILFERGGLVSKPIHADNLGLRSKLGGSPDWDQDDETPQCRSCNREMSFVAQLDSIEHDDPNNPHRVDALSGDQHYMFGDVGILYVFFCFECLEPTIVFQCG